MSKAKEVVNLMESVTEATHTKEQLMKSKKCPICGGKLKLTKKYGKGNLASEKVLHCPTCHSDF